MNRIHKLYLQKSSQYAVVLGVVFIAYFFLCFSVSPVFSCTNLIVTKGASADNACMITYTADSAGFFCRLAIVEASDGTTRPLGGSDVFPEGTKTHRVFGFTGETVISSFQGIMNDCQVAMGETTWGGREELVNKVGKFMYPELMTAAANKITYQPLPKFPATTRDLSLVCDEDTPAAALEKAIKEAIGKILEKVTLFDVYRSDDMKKNSKKSIAYSISMRSHDGTLTDEQADSAMKKALKALSAIGAELRS